MPSFEEQMTALESVVERLERGEMSLEESVQLFEEGMRLTAACRGELDAAEGRLQVLVEGSDGGRTAVDLPQEAGAEQGGDESSSDRVW